MAKKIRIADLPSFDIADQLKSDADIAEYLEQVLADGDAAEIPYAIGVVAKARNMTQLARATGLSREGLYKALSGTGNPSLTTIVKVLRAMNLRLSITAKEVPHSRGRAARRQASDQMAA